MALQDPSQTPAQPEDVQAVEPRGTGPVPVTYDNEAGTTDSGIEAEYTLEAAVRCPGCKRDVERVQVVRALRSRVNFVSVLPRRGQLLICSGCRTVLTGSLGGVL